MACDAEEGEAEGESVDGEEEEVQEDDEVDEAGEEFFGEYGVFFHELAEVVEAGCLGWRSGVSCVRCEGRGGRRNTDREG